MRALGFLTAAALSCALWAAPAAAQERKEGQSDEASSSARAGRQSDEEKRGKLKIEPDQRYLLLATVKTSTMQKELDEAAAQGFRVVTGSPTSTSEWAVLLERTATPAAPYGRARIALWIGLLVVLGVVAAVVIYAIAT